MGRSCDGSSVSERHLLLFLRTEYSLALPCHDNRLVRRAADRRSRFGRRGRKDVFRAVGVPDREALVAAVLDLHAVVRYRHCLDASVRPMPKVERAAFVEQTIIEAVGFLVPLAVIEVARLLFGSSHWNVCAIIARYIRIEVVSQCIFHVVQVVQPVYLPGDLQFGAQRPSFAHTSGELVRPGVVVGVEHERERERHLSDLYRV